MIATEDVAIQTATVDVQVMRIGQRQMTLAVFNQLPLIDEMERIETWPLALFYKTCLTDTEGVEYNVTSGYVDIWGYVRLPTPPKYGPRLWLVVSFEGILYRYGIRDSASLSGSSYYWSGKGIIGDILSDFLNTKELPQLFIAV